MDRWRPKYLSAVPAPRNSGAAKPDEAMRMLPVGRLSRRRGAATTPAGAPGPAEARDKSYGSDQHKNKGEFILGHCPLPEHTKEQRKLPAFGSNGGEASHARATASSARLRRSRAGRPMPLRPGEVPARGTAIHLVS